MADVNDLDHPRQAILQNHKMRLKLCLKAVLIATL